MESISVLLRQRCEWQGQQNMAGLAKKIGISQAVLWQFVRNHRDVRVSVAEKIWRHFGCEVVDTSSHPKCEKCGCNLLLPAPQKKEEPAPAPAPQPAGPKARGPGSTRSSRASAALAQMNRDRAASRRSTSTKKKGGGK